MRSAQVICVPFFRIGRWNCMRPAEKRNYPKKKKFSINRNAFYGSDTNNFLFEFIRDYLFILYVLYATLQKQHLHNTQTNTLDRNNSFRFTCFNLAFGFVSFEVKSFLVLRTRTEKNDKISLYIGSHTDDYCIDDSVRAHLTNGQNNGNANLY